MTEKEFDKILETLIIDGLIKEEEQDNLDFAAVMSKMSDEEFADMVGIPTFADSAIESCSDDDVDSDNEYSVTESSETLRPSASTFSMADESFEIKCEMSEASPVIDCSRSLTNSMSEDAFDSDKNELSVSHSGKSLSSRLYPWIAAAVSAAAVILIVLIPSLNYMNAKLCDSALYMSEDFIMRYELDSGVNADPTEIRSEVYSTSIDQLKEELPVLEQEYQRALKNNRKTDIYNKDIQDTGWALAIAYLKLHKKNDAVKVLKTITEYCPDTPLGKHSTKLLKQLD